MFETLCFQYSMPVSFTELWKFQLLCLQVMCLFSFWETPTHNANVIMLYVVQEIFHVFKVVLKLFCLDRFPLLWLTVHWSIPLYHLIYQFSKIYLFHYAFFFFFFFAVLGLPCCTWAFSSSIEWGSSLVAVHGIHIVVVSLVVEHRL